MVGSGEFKVTFDEYFHGHGDRRGASDDRSIVLGGVEGSLSDESLIDRDEGDENSFSGTGK